jgi:hypothetical protein
MTERDFFEAAQPQDPDLNPLPGGRRTATADRLGQRENRDLDCDGWVHRTGIDAERVVSSRLQLVRSQ